MIGSFPVLIRVALVTAQLITFLLCSEQKCTVCGKIIAWNCQRNQWVLKRKVHESATCQCIS
jgi:hypothetical protein